MDGKYSVVKILTYQKKNPVRIEKVGLILRDKDVNKMIACTFDEAFEMIKNNGSTNVEIFQFTIDEHGYEGRSIRPKAELELQPFENPSWHLSIFNYPFQDEYTEELRKKIELSLKGEMNWNFEVRRRKWKQENRYLFAELYRPEMKEKYSQMTAWIKEAKNIVVFTGEEISREMGFPSLITPEITERMTSHLHNQSPQLFINNYQDTVVTLLADVLPDKRMALVAQAIDYLRPNSIHQFFSALEKPGKKVTILTTAVDGLHKKAGSTNVVPLYGEISILQCNRCLATASLTEVFVNGKLHCEEEECDGMYLPILNWSRDYLPYLENAKRVVSEGDLLILAGVDSGDSMINSLSLSEIQAKKVIISHKVKTNEAEFDLVLNGSIHTILKEVEQKLTSKGPICSVCGENAAEGVFASRIAPTSAYYCQSCIGQGAEPYDVFVTKVALNKKKNQEYQLSPRLQYVLDTTLRVTKMTAERFELDVEKKLEEMVNH